jgi:hypothetical protein
MKIICRGRQTGKTAELVRMSAETGTPIVVLHDAHAKRVIEIAVELNLKIPTPILWAQVKGHKCVLVDDAETLITRFLQCQVMAMTINNDECPHISGIDCVSSRGLCGSCPVRIWHVWNNKEEPEYKLPIRFHDLLNQVIEKPPLGLVPKWVRDEQRREEVQSAIHRYLRDRKPIPPEWVKEYNELSKGEITK